MTGEAMSDDGGALKPRQRSGAGAVTRACVVTVEVMALTAAAHACAGGELPSAGWFAAVSATVLAVSLGVLHRVIRVRTAVATIGSLQVGLHVALHTASVQGHAAHDMDGGTAHGLSTPMLAAHLVTTAVATVLLFVQERVVRRARGWLDSWRRPRPLSLPPRPRLMSSGLSRRSMPRRALLLRSPRRGPPAPAVLTP